jgi:hypothetical protein
LSRSALVQLIATVGVLLASGALRAPDAGAQEGAVKAIFEKHDLLGMFAADCASPASKTNVYFVTRLLDANHVQRDQMSGPTTRDRVTVIDKAIELTADEINVSGKRDDEQPTESVWRFDKDRVLGMENTVGGKKVITGGKWTSNGQNVPPISRCAAASAPSPGSPQAAPPPAQEGSVRAIFEKHDFLGTFAADCSAPVSKSNLYFINRLLDEGHVQRDAMSGPTARDWFTIIDKAVELTSDEISTSGLRNGLRSEIVYRLEKNRSRGVESTLGGKKMIIGGKFIDNGQEAPWLSKCEAAGAPAQSSPANLPAASPPARTVMAAANPQNGSVKAIFEKYNLLGVFAQDCAKPPKAVENWYYVDRLIDANHVQHDLMENETNRTQVTIIDKATENKPNEIFVAGTRDGKQTAAIWRIDKDRRVPWETAFGDQTLISGGKWVKDGHDMPWYTRCGDVD